VEKKENPQKTLLETHIYDKYLKCIDSPNADTIISLCDLVYKWCGKYTFRKKVNDLGVDVCELFDKWVIDRRGFKDKTHFINSLKYTLKNRLIQNYRDCPDGIRISKHTVNIWNEFEKHKTEKENLLYRKLSQTECEELMSEMMATKRNKNKNYFAEYQALMDRRYTISFESLSEPDDEGNKKTEIPDSRVITPGNDHIEDVQKTIIRDVVREILKNENNSCLNDLLTVKFINSPNDLYCLAEFKNNDIIANYEKTGKKPLRQDIYAQYYNPKKSDSAGPGASQLVETFEKKLQKKTKNY